jgi:hypothetical protein
LLAVFVDDANFARANPVVDADKGLCRTFVEYDGAPPKVAATAFPELNAGKLLQSSVFFHKKKPSYQDRSCATQIREMLCPPPDSTGSQQAHERTLSIALARLT